MSVLYSYTFGSIAGAIAMPATIYLSDLEPDEGTDYALVSSVTVWVQSSGTDYSAKLRFAAYGGGWTDYAYVYNIPGGGDDLITFTFSVPVQASISGTRFQLYIAQDVAPTTVYVNTDGSLPYFVVNGEWHSGVVYPGKPVNPDPADAANDVKLHETTVTWESGGDTDSYNLYFGSLSGFLSLVESGITETSGVVQSYNFSNYNDFYYWRVDAVNENGTTAGDEWTFTTMTFQPPLPSGLTPSGDLDPPTGTPNGENNAYTVKRLTACAKNTFYYEDI